VQLLHETIHHLNKSESFIVYCASGNRSGIAKKYLESTGFSKVYDLGSRHNIHRC
jgi:phage shock protein E